MMTIVTLHTFIEHSDPMEKTNWLGGEGVRREWQDDTNMYVYTKITPETNLYADAERTQLETCTG